MWVVTDDHGEGLGNHNWLGHGKHIYNEQLHVPLIIYFSDGSYGGTRVDELVEQVDLLPTILELAGIDAAALERQAKPVAGVSLVPLLSGEMGAHAKRLAFSQRRRYDRVPPPGPDDALRNEELGEKFAIQNNRFKYIYQTELADEFFDLRTDPYEATNLVGAGLPEERILSEVVVGMVELFRRQGVERAQEVNQDALEHLRSLGYTK